jgi:hypothetical protein
MIHHLSIAARDPKYSAEVLAEIMGGNPRRTSSSILPELVLGRHKPCAVTSSVCTPTDAALSG